MCITNNNKKPTGIYRDIDCKPILLEDNFHVRNTICYVFKNALDVGATVDGYKWSTYKTMFGGGVVPPGAHPVSFMRYRQVRDLFRTDSIPKGVPWKVCQDGMLAPASFCDYKYAEEAFCGDINFFMRTLGLVDNAQMKQQMVVNPQKRMSLEELVKFIDEKSRQRFKVDADRLTYDQKIPLVKSVFYSTRSSIAQLARCFGMKKEQVREILDLEEKDISGK